MNKFIVHNGLVAPLDRTNVDTDAIIPKQFLKSIKRSGFGPHLFDQWRYLDHGELGIDNSKRSLNLNFMLNQPRYHGASILLTRQNFGCGSSREHAAWALHQYGFRVIIAPSFADIFFNNCFKNGLLPVVLLEIQINHLFNLIKECLDFRLIVNLIKQVIIHNNNLSYSFEISEFHKYSLLNGLDDIDLTLRQEDKIRIFEKNHLDKYPWLNNAI